MAATASKDAIRSVIRGLERRADGQKKVAASYDGQVTDLQTELAGVVATQSSHKATEKELRTQIAELSKLVS